MKRRTFIKLLGGSPALLYLISCAGSKSIGGQGTGLLYSFIFSNDIHVSTDEHAAYIEQSVKDWNSFSQKYDFVVMCGDLVNNGTANEFVRVKAKLDLLEKPWYPVVGNHDVTGTGDEGKTAYREAFGDEKENYYVIHKNTALLFLDLTDGTNATVEIKKHTVDWLSAALAKIPKRMPIIVFSHFPLHPNVSMFKVNNATFLFDLLDKRSLLAFFSGHYHARWQDVRNNVPFFTNTCMSQQRDNHDGSPQEGYLLVEVYSNEVKTQFYEKGSVPAV